MSTLLHTVGHNWHAAVSRSPHCVSIAYLRLLSVLIRSLPEGHFKDRLLNNIRSNGFLEVQTFKCALGDRMGIAAFHEPEGHLTNGSLLPAFSSLFSKDVKRRQVPVLCGEVLADLLVDQTRLLIKIDAEGAEPMILRALAPVLAKWKPDLLIEVLPGWDAELQHLQVLAEYIPFHITPQGLVRSASVAAGQATAGQERDLLLIHKENTP